MGRVNRAALVLAGIVAGLSACGSQDDTQPALPAPVSVPPITAPAVTDSDALQAELLGPADVPVGFTELSGTAPGTAPAPPDRSHTDPAQCAKVLAPLADLHDGSTARGAVHYSSPNFASIDIDIAGYSDGGAADAFSAVQKLIRECHSYSGTDADGIPVAYRLSGLEQPTAGAASVSFQVRTTSEGLSLYSAATVAVVGSSVVQVAQTAPSPVDPAALHDLTDTQVRRLKGIAGP